MGSFISILKVLIAILPMLRDLITAAEAAFPAQGSGYQKLELVKTLLQNVYSAATKIETPFEAIWPVISNLITYAVPLFTKSSAAAQVDTTAAQVHALAQSRPVDTDRIISQAAQVQLSSDA